MPMPPEQNPLATKPIGSLMFKFAVPSILSSLITAAYNITDQIFIGHGVGYLGNAATNIAFPLTTLCLATSIMLGVGSASNFSLFLGQGKKDDAARVVGTGISLTLILGIIIAAAALIFTAPLMRAFGATDQVFPYAFSYTRITAMGIPFVLFSTVLSHLIRADGRPLYSMLCIAAGAALNICLDPLFIFVLGMGIEGAAYATVISQLFSFVLVARYLRRFSNINLPRTILRVDAAYMAMIARLGIPGFLNHFMMMLVQITMNNTLRVYGEGSIYGSDIPLAVVGVIAKLNIIIIAFTVGIALGCQPIFGFNYGAKNYARVKSAYKRAAVAVIITSSVAFICFQLFPRQIVGIFGTGSELYFQFAERYMRIFMFMVFAFGIQPLTSNFFTSIGKAYKGLFITVTRQGLFLLPLLLILPRFMGFDGIVYAGPVSDCAAVLMAVIFIAKEFRSITQLENKLKET